MQVQSCKNGLDVYRDIKVNIYIKLSISAIISPIELAWSVGNIPHSDFIAPTQPFIEREEEEDSKTQCKTIKIPGVHDDDDDDGSVAGVDDDDDDGGDAGVHDDDDDGSVAGVDDDDAGSVAGECLMGADG